MLSVNDGYAIRPTPCDPSIQQLGPAVDAVRANARSDGEQLATAVALPRLISALHLVHEAALGQRAGRAFKNVRSNRRDSPPFVMTRDAPGRALKVRSALGARLVK